MTAPYTMLYSPTAVSVRDLLSQGAGGERPAVAFRRPSGERKWATERGDAGPWVTSSIHDFEANPGRVAEGLEAAGLPSSMAPWMPEACKVCDKTAPSPQHAENWALALRWEGQPCILSRRRATYLLARFEELAQEGGSPMPEGWDPEGWDPEAMFYKHHASDLWYLTGLEGFQHTYEFVSPKEAPNAECVDGHTLDYSDEDTHEIVCNGEPRDTDEALATILVSRLGGTLHILEKPC